jgi:hypothetical protein
MRFGARNTLDNCYAFMLYQDLDGIWRAGPAAEFWLPKMRLAAEWQRNLAAHSDPAVSPFNVAHEFDKIARFRAYKGRKTSVG